MLILWVLYCILCKNAKNVTRFINLNKWLIGSKKFCFCDVDGSDMESIYADN